MDTAILGGSSPNHEEHGRRVLRQQQVRMSLQQRILQAQLIIDQDVLPALERLQYEYEVARRLQAWSQDAETREEWEVQANVLHEMVGLQESQLEEQQRWIAMCQAMLAEVEADLAAWDLVEEPGEPRWMEGKGALGMCIQEAALYGDLVLALRDYAAEQLAVLDPGLEEEAARIHLDDFIRHWFFTPQEDLYGAAPREVIWREQLGEPNLLPKRYAAEVFHDDCPLCQMMRAEIESAGQDEDHGHCWVYCPDHCLLDRYDPEGSEERWNAEFARLGLPPRGEGLDAD